MFVKVCSGLPDHQWKITCSETLTDQIRMFVPSMSTAEYFGGVTRASVLQCSPYLHYGYLPQMCFPRSATQGYFCRKLHLLFAHVPEAGRTSSLAYCFLGDQLIQEGLVGSSSFVSVSHKKLSLSMWALTKPSRLMHWIESQKIFSVIPLTILVFV